ncbi:MAG: SPOR domain-containing protein [Proteobacteria bacterium]|nr:SPOR domain-containing protein [Pseudomonadota bacterium]
MRTSQRGGFVIGMIVGLLIGLALALGVALYVTKVPVPFVNKVPQRTPEKDAAEAEKNKNWDPNSPLYGKNPAHAATSASGTVAPAPDAGTPGAVANAPQAVPPTLPPPIGATPSGRASAPAGTRDPAAILNGALPAPTSTASAPARPDRSFAGAPAADPFIYFVQAGAYGRTEDAEQQRAKLAMMGLQSKLTEREQAGRTMYRVRLGPFDSKDEADAAKTRLDGAGIDAALVRVQRQ